ncbi:MAG: adenylyl-sulfate kinase [Lentisphaerae bacterium]|nr:adenylyl-sulfate kinase [Lentisphaerota bacterium]
MGFDVSMKRNSREHLRIKPGVLWFTGLSGSGKSTIAEEIVADLEKQGVDIEYFDGDRVRNMFPNTGFTRQERDEHIRRIGFLASMLEKHGVFVVASFVSPYEEARRFVRDLCGNFIEVYVSTPVQECERRDVKGLYARARAGEIHNFTGVNDPYEPPPAPELTIDTTDISVESACDIVMNYLEKTAVR